MLVKQDTIYDDKLLAYADQIEDEHHRKAVKLFIKVMRAGEEANYIPEKDLRAALLKYASEDITPKGDNYEDILDLFRMVIFIGTTTRGNLYLEYLTKLENYFKDFPNDLGYLRNLFYTTAANCHTRNDHPEKAIEADRKLLEIISSLENKYKKLGRNYRDYSRYYYISYRRMLNNYKALSKDEINDLYNKCLKLAESDPEIAKDFYGEGRPIIYKMMSDGDYADLVPRLKKSLPLVRDNYTKLQLTGLLVEAADSINDTETLLTALKVYNKMLRERIKEHSDEAYSELQIRYDVEQLKQAAERLRMEKKEAELATVQKLIAVGLIAVLIMVVIIMFLYRSNYSLKRVMRNLKKENDNLHKTIEDVVEDHDYVPGTLDVREGKQKESKVKVTIKNK